MAERKRSMTERDDPLAVEALRVIANVRDAQPLLGEFLKASQKFTQQLSAAVTAGGAMLEALAKLADHQGGDLGEGIKHLFELQKAIEEHRHQVIQAWNDQLQADLINRLPNDKVDIATWEKNYKTKRGNSVKALKKAEANQQKCNKPKPKAKAPEKAAESDRQLEQATADHDRLLREELRDVVRLERKKYCRFIQQFGYLVDIQANMAQADLNAIAACRASLANLGESEELVTGKARLLLNDEGTPPPAYVPPPTPALAQSNGSVSLASAGSTKSSRSLSSASSRNVLAAPMSVVQAPEPSIQYADFDPISSTAALLGPMGGVTPDTLPPPMDFQAGAASYVDYSQSIPSNLPGPPLDDLLKDDLWDLVNGGVAAAAGNIYSDAPPADADIAAALRDIDELAINL